MITTYAELIQKDEKGCPLLYKALLENNTQNLKSYFEFVSAVLSDVESPNPKSSKQDHIKPEPSAPCAIHITSVLKSQVDSYCRQLCTLPIHKGENFFLKMLQAENLCAADSNEQNLLKILDDWFDLLLPYSSLIASDGAKNHALMIVFDKFARAYLDKGSFDNQTVNIEFKRLSILLSKMVKNLTTEPLMVLNAAGKSLQTSFREWGIAALEQALSTNNEAEFDKLVTVVRYLSPFMRLSIKEKNLPEKQTLSEWLNEKNANYVPLFTYPIVYQNLSLSTKILGYDLDINAVDLELRSVLHHCVIKGSYEIFNKILKSKGVAYDMADVYGRTAMHYCAIYHRERMMKLLISLGVNLNSLDNNNATPLYILRASQFKGLMLTLRHSLNHILLRTRSYEGEDLKRIHQMTGKDLSYIRSYHRLDIEKEGSIIPSPEVAQMFASAEYLGHHLIYETLIEGLIEPIIDEDGQVRFYETHSLLDTRTGICGYVLTPKQTTDACISNDLKILFRGSDDKASWLRDTEMPAPGTLSFYEQTHRLIVSFNQVIKTHFKSLKKQSKITNTSASLSVSISGHSLGGGDAQRMLTLIMLCIAQMHGLNSTTVKVETIVDALRESLENNLSEGELAQKLAHFKEVAMATLSFLSYQTHHMDEIKYYQHIKELKLYTFNATGVTQETHYWAKGLAALIKDHCKLFLNHTMVSEDIVQLSGDNIILSDAPHKLATVRLLLMPGLKNSTLKVAASKTAALMVTSNKMPHKSLIGDVLGLGDLGKRIFNVLTEGLMGGLFGMLAGPVGALYGTIVGASKNLLSDYLNEFGTKIIRDNHTLKHFENKKELPKDTFYFENTNPEHLTEIHKTLSFKLGQMPLIGSTAKSSALGTASRLLQEREKQKINGQRPGWD